MSEQEITQKIHESEEVEVYPKILLFIAVDWETCISENPDLERRVGFGLAAIYSEIILDDIKLCREIGKLSGIEQACSMPPSIVTSFVKPNAY